MKPGANILLIDDNREFRGILRDYLKGKGFEVFEADDGEHALELMQRTRFHMAIVDLDMPRMNGIEFSKKAKAKTPKFPIILITGYAQFYAPGDILSAGVDAFLQKPLDLETLMKAIERL
jgi:CheY-like chemotaxis protein